MQREIDLVLAEHCGNKRVRIVHQTMTARLDGFANAARIARYFVREWPELELAAQWNDEEEAIVDKRLADKLRAVAAMPPLPEVNDLTH